MCVYTCVSAHVLCVSMCVCVPSCVQTEQSQANVSSFNMSCINKEVHKHEKTVWLYDCACCSACEHVVVAFCVSHRGVKALPLTQPYHNPVLNAESNEVGTKSTTAYVSYACFTPLITYNYCAISFPQETLVVTTDLLPFSPFLGANSRGHTPLSGVVWVLPAGAWCTGVSL